MIDIHTHILYGVDDGATNIEESIKIIEKLKNIGFKKIVLTPHYIDSTEYIIDSSSNQKKLSILKRELENKKIDIELYLGNEIYISDNIINKIKDKKISPINDNYLLIELPLVSKIEYALDMLLSIKSEGYKIILAHPERYTFFQNNPKLIQEYLNLGILMQGNILSIRGKYGKSAKKLFRLMLKKRQYFVLSTDVHKCGSDVFRDFNKLKRKLIRLSNIRYFNELLIDNPKIILEDKIYEKSI